MGCDIIRKRTIFLDIGREQVSGTGMAVYTRRLHEQLARLNPDIHFIAIPIVDNVSLKNKFYAHAYEQLILPFLMLFKKGICHRTSNIGVPFFCLTPYIITIHDIIPVLMPEHYLKSPFRRIWFGMRQWWAAKASVHIITDSECSRKDLLIRYRVPESKISVISLGIDSCYAPQDAAIIKSVCTRYNIHEKYVLSIGGEEYRKNNRRLIEAFRKLKSRSEIPHKLVIVGKYGSRAGLSIDGNTDDVIMTGFINMEDLPSLYAGADLFVFPSLYEGFGLPVLEAQACGTAVACSNTSSLPEVGNASVAYFDPEDIESISDAIYKVISDPDLRNELINKGFRNCESFSWRDTAMKTLKVYQEFNGRL